ncbi:Helicase MOV-10 [Vermiconidia calcicola]|uniref:Helicase MOV-10 n=1 Tax=Vermiconidia calcicola TaxID=1690605 RepID=A0ACC3NTI2_9PEZI|nr:Helicase MOV-10 [Vermiconidia calcicola]
MTYITSLVDRLPEPLWLVDANSTSYIYPTKTDTVARSHFATPKAYSTHYIAALLYDRDETIRQQEEIFSFDRSYPAFAQHLHGNHWNISIRLAGDESSTSPSCVKIIPSARSKISLYHVEMSVPTEPATAFVGKVSSTTVQNYDFTVEVLLPAHLQDQELLPADLSRFFVLWTDHDEDNRRKLAAIHKAAFVRKTLKEPLVDEFGKMRGRLSLWNIIGESSADYVSQDLVRNFFADAGDDDDDHEESPAALYAVFDHAALTASQGEFVLGALEGVHSAVAILEGFPGSGKTTTLAVFIVCALLVGQKVMVVSQSNNGVDALFEAVVNTLITHAHQDLLDSCVRFRKEANEITLTNYLDTGLTQGDGEFAVVKYWMSSRIDEYCKTHQNDPVVQDYYVHLNAQRNGKRAASSHSWDKMRGLMRNKILKQSNLVGCTAFVATTLAEGEVYRPDIVIFDEAGQATDPDLMMAVVDYVDNLKLLILAGDTKQLGPVVKSLQRNVLGNVLESSCMERIKTDRPDIPVFTLEENFRGPISTFEMASQLFYDGAMRAGGDPARWARTPLAQTMIPFLHGNELAPAFRNRDLALENDNRQFFMNVIGTPIPEEDGTSYWNPPGVVAVVSFARYLINRRLARAEDIGIISMYAEDVRRIRSRLDANHLYNVSVANANIKASTVDAFQGKQKRVVLVHFVATFDIQEGRKDPFGFIKNDRRLNVATTRSQEFQFLFGNFTCWSNFQKRFFAHTVGKSKIGAIMEWVEDRGQVLDWNKVLAVVRNASIDPPA